MEIIITEHQQAFLLKLLQREQQNLDILDKKINSITNDILSVDEDISISGLIDTTAILEERYDHITNLIFKLVTNTPNQQAMENL
ncbi:MAG: hypothetical protein KDH96_02910 [Candidatus Riesia sp.]|nr:hypothetical protein [Candidatus Riesia sp.]